MRKLAKIHLLSSSGLPYLSVCSKFTAADFVEFLRVDVFTAFVVEFTFFWGMTQCRFAVCYPHFGGACSHVIFDEIEGGRRMPVRSVDNVIVNTASYTAGFLSSSSSLFIHIPIFYFEK
jgi:hypothetical protein